MESLSDDRLNSEFTVIEELNIRKGTFLTEQHQVVDFLGEGAYGYVTKCLRTATSETEAVKISKKIPGLHPLEKQEITILRQLRGLNPDTSFIIKCKGCFSYQDHACLSFELLDQDLREYVQDRGEGLHVPEIRSVIRQVTTALWHLSSCRIVHADVRPDNIMLVDRTQQPIRVRLIDFGLAFHVGKRPFFQAPGYRAPEALLGIHPLTEAVDMWSLGATIMELATACTIFEGDEEYDELSQIIQSYGQPTDDLLDQGEDTETYFSPQNHSERRWRFKSAKEYADETGNQAQKLTSITLHDIPTKMPLGPLEEKNLFLDLLHKMMQLNHKERIKPSEVLQHPFLSASSLITNTEKDNVESNHAPLVASSEKNISSFRQRPLLSPCVDPDTAEARSDGGLQSLEHPGAQENTPCIIPLPNISGDRAEGNSDGVYLEPDLKKTSYFSCLFNCFADIYHCLFPDSSSQGPSPN